MINCKECNAANEEDSLVCRWCGAEIEPSTNKTNKNKSINRKKRNRMLITIFTAVILLSSLAVILIPRLSASIIGGGKQQGIKLDNNSADNNVQNPSDLVLNHISPTPTTANTNTTKQQPSFYYLKEGKVYIVGAEDLKPRVVINNLYSKDGRTDSILVSEDGTRLFYPQNHEEQAVGVNIFTYNLASKVEERSRIDSNIKNYAINQDGTRMYYIKDDNVLYVSDLTKSEKIQEGVDRAYINKTGDRVVYCTTGLYLKNYGQEKQKIADEAMLLYVSQDLNTIYYIQNQFLFLFKNGEKVELIDSEVSDLSFVYDDGTIYYKKYANMIFADFIDDDKAAFDAALKEPKREDYPNSKSYMKDNEIYQQKLDRDQIRQDSKTTSMNGNWYSLYCYSDGKSKLISDCCDNVWGAVDQNRETYTAYFTGYGKPYLVYSKLKGKNIGKIKMSKISSMEDIDYFIRNKVTEYQEYYICLGSTILKKIGKGIYSDFIFDENEKGLYYRISSQNSFFKGDLYYSSIKGNSIAEGKRRAENVYSYFPKTESLIYIKNLIEERLTGDMYVDDKIVDSDVSAFPLIQSQLGDKTFLYVKNISNGEGPYTLKIYQNGSTEKIANNVSSYKQIDSKTIVYTSEDLSMKKRNLYLYDGSNNRILIDTEVDKIIEPSINSYFTMDAMFGLNY